jgi:hypothetical protein
MKELQMTEILCIIFETEPKLLDKGMTMSWWETFQDEDYSIARRAALKMIDADIMGKPKRSDFKKMLKIVKDEKKRSQPSNVDQGEVFYVWRDQYGDVGERSERFCYRTAVLPANRKAIEK